MTENPMLRHQKLTILQQIDELKNWHKQQQSKLNCNGSSEENVDLIEDKGKQTPTCEIKNKTMKLETNNNQNNKAPLSNFDDTLVKGVNSNLHSIIENNIPLLENQQFQTSCNTQKPKFKFLKKGEGIARFRMGPVKIQKSKSSNKLHLQSSTIHKQSSKPIIDNDENVNKPLEVENMPSLKPPDLKLNLRNWKSILNNGNAMEVIENAIDSNQLDLFNPNASIDSSTASIMERLLAVGKIHLKEREEMRIFETIEQHVLDSSFCSTSSYVTKLMENAVMSSTPEKTISEYKQLNKNQPKQLCPDVLKEIEVGNIDGKEVEVNKKNEKTPVWTQLRDKENSDYKFNTDPTNSELEESLHVRFNEEVDYKSFIEYSQTLNSPRDKKYSEQFEDSEEWKDDECSEGSSVCCSQCSSSIVLDDDVGKPTELKQYENVKNQINTHIVKQNPVEVLDVKGLSTDNHKNSGTTESSAEEIDMLSPKLNAKLKELENEIEAFRTENNKLKTIREKLEKEHKQFQLDKKKFLNELEEERKKNGNYLEEEKKKLAKEKFIFEKYSKNLAKKPLKEERKEIEALKEQLSEMKEELNKKESRWGAAQARVRNQVKLLEEDNKKLREEIEVLRKQAKSLQILTQKKNKPTNNNTKLIHAINEHISNLVPGSEDNISKDCGYFSSNINSIEMVTNEKTHPKTSKSAKVVKEITQNQATFDETQNNSLRSQERNSFSREETTKTNNVCLQPVDQRVNTLNDRTSGGIDQQQSKVTSKTPDANTMVSSVTEIINEDGNVEKIFPDGRKEIILKNGNVKKIDPISGNVKTIYFNGDVKELTSDGTVKYYFSESRIWHTTFPDGLEVLDFPNGQVEKKFTNGVTEIVYSSGCKKITHPDGVEEIFYTDGTNIKIDSNKKKILSLPNGQKEIHTDDYIRREYPDGTVKIVYPDGTTETVYSNGRVRLKDKHGNLVMDSKTAAPIHI